MTKQPEDWLDDVPGDDIEDEDDEIIWVSKSEIKRDAEELKRLGAELVGPAVDRRLRPPGRLRAACKGCPFARYAV